MITGLFVLITCVLLVVAVTVILVIKYLDRRENGQLHISIKLRFFEFKIDVAAEKAIKGKRGKSK